MSWWWEAGSWACGLPFARLNRAPRSHLLTSSRYVPLLPVATCGHRCPPVLLRPNPPYDCTCPLAPWLPYTQYIASRIPSSTTVAPRHDVDTRDLSNHSSAHTTFHHTPLTPTLPTLFPHTLSSLRCRTMLALFCCVPHSSRSFCSSHSSHLPAHTLPTPHSGGMSGDPATVTGVYTASPIGRESTST
jgi:hypothetical protein